MTQRPVVVSKEVGRLGRAVRNESNDVVKALAVKKEPTFCL